MITNKVLKQRVQRGLTWVLSEGEQEFGLDLDLVDLGQLNVVYGLRCVLGQANRLDYGYSRVTSAKGNDFCHRHGFSLTDEVANPDRMRDYNRLTAFWIEAITEYRASVAAVLDEAEIALLEGSPVCHK